MGERKFGVGTEALAGVGVGGTEIDGLGKGFASLCWVRGEEVDADLE